MRESCQGCKKDAAGFMDGMWPRCLLEGWLRPNLEKMAQCSCKEFVGLAHAGAWPMLIRPKSCCGAQDMFVGACEWTGCDPDP